MPCLPILQISHLLSSTLHPAISCLTMCFFLVSAILFIVLTSSPSNNTPGKPCLISIYCPPDFNALTTLIYYPIIFYYAVIVMRFLAKYSKVFIWRPSAVPSCNSTAVTPKEKVPSFGYFSRRLVATSTITPSLLDILSSSRGNEYAVIPVCPISHFVWHS
jgi:hypothetical protein